MKHSRNQRLSEHLLHVDEEILTNAYNVDDAEKLKTYKKTKHTNIRPIYAARKPIRKAVWVPAVAAAACVALTVGLWQGGVFDPAEIPVETPDVSTTTAEATEPSEDATTTTTEPTDSSKTNEPSKTTATTTEKPTNPSKTEPTKTTEPSKTTKPIIINGKKVVFADESSGFIPNSRPIGGYLHGTVKEKIEQYKGQDVLYAVIVEVLTLPEEYHELYPPDNAPQPKDEWENEEEWREYAEEYLNRYLDQRVKKLKEITNKELIPISTDDKYWAFYTDEEYAFLMELTAEEIDKLDKCDCFFMRLRHPDGDAEAGIVIPE